jgi:hypothetical protein
MLKVDLLRQSMLFFQIFDQLLEALGGDGVVSQGSRPLGLLQPPLKFFSVALFIHGDTVLSIRRGRGNTHHRGDWSAVSLTTYDGGPGDFMRTPLDETIDQIAAGTLHVNVGKVFHLNEIAEAHRCMEENKAGGKIVVLT